MNLIRKNGKVNQNGKLENPGIILLQSGIKNPTLRIKVKENNKLQEDAETKKKNLMCLLCGFFAT
jgi:hypothetical protein